VIHVRKSSESALTCYNELNAKVTAAMWGHTKTDTGVYEVDVTPLDGTSATADYATGLPAKWKGGVTAGDVIQPQTAVVVKLLTAVRGRSYRGRIFLPFVADSVTSPGILASGTQGTMQTAWTTFFGALTTDSWELVVASYKHSSATAVTSVLVESQVGTQRRRNPR